MVKVIMRDDVTVTQDDIDAIMEFRQHVGMYAFDEQKPAGGCRKTLMFQRKMRALAAVIDRWVDYVQEPGDEFYHGSDDQKIDVALGNVPASFMRPN